MKTIHPILIAVTCLTIATASAPALSLPVSEDTFNNQHGILTPTAGKAATLLLNTNQAAFVKFDLSSLPASVAPTNISSARLKLFVVTCRAAGDLTVTLITSPWTEAVTINTTMPSFDPTIVATVSAAKVLTKHFVTLDVTSTVIAALNGTGPDFGFMLHDSKGQTFIASKEGPSQGPAPELEIEANLAQNASGDGGFPGSLNIGGNVGIGGDAFIAGLLHQGSETGTAEPAGKAIIVRRLQSTNSAMGSIVARTDTLTLERDGTLGGMRIVNTANPGDTVIVGIAEHETGYVIGKDIVLPSDAPAGTNVLFSDNLGILYFRCSLGNPAGLGHHTEVSLTRSPNNASPVWIGNMISTYNQ